METEGGEQEILLTGETIEINYGKIDDVLVNGISVVEDNIADIKLKTINNQAVEGTGNIQIDGVTDYNQLSNKPQINGVTLTGDKVGSDLGLQNYSDNSLQTTDKTIVGAINEVDNIAKGANQALSYVNYQEMVADFNTALDSKYKVGQNIYVLTLDVPDLWVSSVETTSIIYTYTTDEAFINALDSDGYVQVGYYKLSALETQEVDLTNYISKSGLLQTTGTAIDNTMSQNAITTALNTKANSSDVVTDVQINGTSIKSSGVANIPVAGTSSANKGVVWAQISRGIELTNDGEMRIQRASDGAIEAKSSGYYPITPSGLDHAVKVGITTNTETLTDTEKANAQSWLGIEEVDLSDYPKKDEVINAGYSISYINGKTIYLKSTIGSDIYTNPSDYKGLNISIFGNENVATVEDIINTDGTVTRNLKFTLGENNYKGIRIFVGNYSDDTDVIFRGWLPQLYNVNNPSVNLINPITSSTMTTTWTYSKKWNIRGSMRTQLIDGTNYAVYTQSGDTWRYACYGDEDLILAPGTYVFSMNYSSTGSQEPAFYFSLGVNGSYNKYTDVIDYIVDGTLGDTMLTTDVNSGLNKGDVIFFLDKPGNTMRLSESVAEGYNTSACGATSHAAGYGTETWYDNQFAIGKYNNNSSTNIFEIGNGTADNSRSNAFEVKSDGTAIVQTQGTTNNSVAQKQYVDNKNQFRKIYDRTLSTAEGPALDITQDLDGNSFQVKQFRLTLYIPADAANTGSGYIRFRGDAETSFGSLYGSTNYGSTSQNCVNIYEATCLASQPLIMEFSENLAQATTGRGNVLRSISNTINYYTYFNGIQIYRNSGTFPAGTRIVCYAIDK